ncbi:polyprenyl synthetase family protein [Mucilaginibacter sp.]|jgi:octaprenyl-diphosphate synthase|uniref:polyprenyl synthetase family protein n=1 Tax=Mucilaginibacter sp. TaxID=1882438 RepID=UPI00356ADD5A
MELESIKEPVAAEMAAFAQNLQDSLQSKVELMNVITGYLMRVEGKQIRPLFVFLCAGVSGEINPGTNRAAILVELLHTASLVHDDVVDASSLRRGRYSVNALWRNKTAIRAGDFIFARSMLLALENGDFGVLKILSDTLIAMAEGELLQMEKARRLLVDENVYYEIIKRKTASLIAACCSAGALSAGADPKTVKKLHTFGELAGIAFQIRDDIFDYSDDQTGKPPAMDVKEKKITLPLLFALQHCTKRERKRWLQLLKNHHDNPRKIAEIINFVKVSGGLDYAAAKMQEYADKALLILNHFPQGPMLTSLEALIRFTTSRKK